MRATVHVTILVALVQLVRCQFGLQQQSNSFQQTGFQPVNQNFGFPNILPQYDFAFPNYQTTRPQNNPQTNQNQQPPISNNNPWFYPIRFQEQTVGTTQRPTTFFTSQQTQATVTTARPFRVVRGVSKTSIF